MNTEPITQASESAPVQPLRAPRGPVQPLTVAEALALPALNGPSVIQRLFQIHKTRFARLNKEGAFDFLKAVPAVGPKCFSGILIGRYLCKEPLYIPSFGRRRA